MRIFSKLLQLSHRYIGIPLSFMFVVWFVSAFFMIYTGGMPRITPDMQADGMQAIDFSSIKISPAQAVATAGFSPPAAALRMILGRPVYELGEPGYAPIFIAADTGEELAPLTEQQGAQLASEFLAVPGQLFTYEGTLYEPDQWTLSSEQQLPLFKYLVDDGLGTEVYVSPDAAQVSVYTTRQSRALAWMGTIPHWLYFAGLRNNQPLWYKTVVYLAYAGCVLAVLGLLLGLTRFRKVRPFNLRKAIPYQGGMRWHYILGSVFGLFSFTWVFSGLVSMEPWDWTYAEGLRVDPAALQEADLAMEDFPSPAVFAWSALVGEEIKELRFSRVLGLPYLRATYSVAAEAGSSKRDRLHQPYNINGQSSAASSLLQVSDGQLQQMFPVERLARRLDAVVTDASIAGYELLQEYDNYYYSRQGQLNLPVLRVQFDDPLATWVYVDPVRGQVLSVIHKYSRVERWLYSGLHSLDFAFWYHNRPFWDLGMLLLLSGGLATSLLGLYFGLRRLWVDIGSLRSRPGAQVLIGS